MQEVAWLLLNGCDFEGAKSSLLEDRCPFLEYDLPDVDPTSSNRDQTRTAPRCLKTHLKEVRANTSSLFLLDYVNEKPISPFSF